MEANKQENGEEDLSMEDILQSIRRIIADDDTKEEDKPAEVSSEMGLGDESPIAVSDILELTDMIEDDGSITNVKDAPAVDVLDNIDAALTPPAKSESSASTAKEQPVVAEPATEELPSSAGSESLVLVAEESSAMIDPAAEPIIEKKPDANLDALLSKAAEEAAISSLFKLKSSDEKSNIQSPSFRSGATVEDMVENLLRPMMKNWLDSNLPTIVERIVEREVIRLTRR